LARRARACVVVSVAACIRQIRLVFQLHALAGLSGLDRTLPVKTFHQQLLIPEIMSRNTDERIVKRTRVQIVFSSQSAFRRMVTRTITMLEICSTNSRVERRYIRFSVVEHARPSECVLVYRYKCSSVQLGDTIYGRV
jgi:hypothetical protein